MSKILSSAFLFCFLTPICSECLNAQAQVWDARLEIPDRQEKAVEFQLEFEDAKKGDRPRRARSRGYIVNGEERIEIPVVDFSNGYLIFKFPHYDSMITTQISRAEFNSGLSANDVIRGQYKKRRGNDRWAEMKFVARQGDSNRDLADPEPFLGRWKVKFDSSEDPAVGVFRRAGKSNQVVGTFLTTTGDYRYLGGYVSGETLVLCCFDGAHAFRFEAQLTKAGQLAGDFWSSNTWHEKWTAVKDDNAKLPDAFAQTKIAEQIGFQKLQFPDLDGTIRSLNDIAFRGKARMVYVFGSWCPNCHDAAAYFKELQEKYGSQGLKILGLAFELTSDHERNANQVKMYLQRHDVSYPVLIAGPADKSKASKEFPVLDRVRSYPTTIFLDGSGVVRGVHTGFTGPATGERYEELKKKFESLIEEMLADRSTAEPKAARGPNR